GALLAAGIALTRLQYAPKVVLRVVESDRDPAGMPRLKRELGKYVREAAFTSEPLLALVRRYDLYPGLVRENPHTALESFREDIDVDVYQNYFLEERARGSAPRSARLAVSYHASDPERALAVTRELAALIVEHERAARQREAERAANEAENAR